MDAKDVLRAPLKPFLDLLDRRVYNLARLIDDKTNGLDRRIDDLEARIGMLIRQHATPAPPSSTPAPPAGPCTAALQDTLHESTSQILAGLGTAREDLAGVEARVANHVSALARVTVDTQEAYIESLGFVGRALREIRQDVSRTPAGTESMVARLSSRLDQLAAEVTALTGRDDYERAYARPQPAATPPRDNLDAAAADLVNYATSHVGYAAKAGLWFNGPMHIVYEAGGVRLSSVNERIAEVPFVFAALGSLPRGARILDVGGMESTVALSLACLGYDVTTVDPRGYSFIHPNLTAITAPIEQLGPEVGRFDAVVCLSTIEHLGLGAYDGSPAINDGDRHAMRAIESLAAPGARLALTVPYGIAGQDDFQRTYDRAGLGALLEHWDILRLVVIEQQSHTTWTLVDPESPVRAARRVAMVSGRLR